MIRFLGCGPDSDDLTGNPDWDEQVAYGYGYAGEGWYLVCSTYPEEGAEFIPPHEYGALLVAQTIVDAEREEIRAEMMIATLLASGLRMSKTIAKVEGGR